MNLFEMNLVLFGDQAGLGAYEVGHFLQHDQYNGILAAQGILIPPWDIRRMRTENENEFATWLTVHETVHEFLRGHTGVAVADLSYFDPKSPESFQVWQENHRAEHAAFDQRFGTT